MIKTRNGRHDQFIAELENLRVWYGGPTITVIAELTGRLSELFPERGEDQQLQALTPQTISAVLRGERGNPPDGEWVAAYVLALIYFGWKVGVHPKPDPAKTEATLAEWQERRYRACVNAAPGEPATAEPEETEAAEGAEGDADGPSLQDDPAASAAHGPLPAAGPVEPISQTPYLSQQERAHLAGYGAPGQLLLEGYTADDPAAMYQIGVLLAINSSSLDTPRWLITYAASADHPGAAELLDEIGSRAALAAHAELIATAHNVQSIATLFRECAHACRPRPPTPT